jgi:long-chain-fatty-acid--[acyl-carrier-protein] ligase
MKKLIIRLITILLWIAFWFRYKVVVKGLENLNPQTLNKKGGVLFLSNHPALFIDPSMVSLLVESKYPIRPIVTEYVYYSPGVKLIMKLINALPMPDFDSSNNSLKRRRAEKSLHEVAKGLEKGDNFIIYPSGAVQSFGYEVVGGSSSVNDVLNAVDDVNVVLIRVRGMWGSLFSRAYLGRTPPLFPTLLTAGKYLLKNLFFFMPRREVTIEFEPAPKDFPYKTSRLELNRYLEDWFNYPDGDKTKAPGEPLQRVSYSFWKKEILPAYCPKELDIPDADISQIPDDVRNKVFAFIAKMTELPYETIKENQMLSSDLGLDSLDISELVVFLDDQFEVHGVTTRELTSVYSVLELASKKVTPKGEEDSEIEIGGWLRPPAENRLSIYPGKLIPEVFLNCCDANTKEFAASDLRSGMLTFGTMKLRTILLAEYIKELPGEYIGIMLPASVAATVAILATQLAGKVPVMINWTVGPRHLDQVVSLSGVQKVLTSWSFVDKLSNVDFTPIEDKLLMLEDVRKELSLVRKLKAWVLSRRSTASILQYFDIADYSTEQKCVLLFTSGTESMPKGVPLSHKNILFALTSVSSVFPYYASDILLGMLPPFHSFGFTVTSLMPILCGMRVAFSPDPTDGKKLAKAVQRWGVTLVCGAPTFLKNMFKAAKPGQLKTIRWIVSGAESAPRELFTAAQEHNLKDKISQGYGITECSPVISICCPDDPKVGVGKAAPGIEVIIIHPETHELLPPNTEGLILVRGANVFSGYINKDAKNPFLTLEGHEWYNTGDLGFVDENQSIVISGRLKRFLKIGGEMISLGSIESALLDMAEAQGWQLAAEGPSLAVCGLEVSGDKPKIYVFTLFETNIDELNAALRKSGVSNIVRITNHKMLPLIPLMGTGKIHYRQLEAENMV